MPKVKILGVVPDVSDDNVSLLKRQVMAALAGITVLGIRDDQVKVFVPDDRCPEELRPSLMVEVIDLFDKPGQGKPECDPVVCQTVAAALKIAIMRWARVHMTRCRNVETEVFRLYRGRDGYDTGDPHDLDDATRMRNLPGCG